MHFFSLFTVMTLVHMLIIIGVSVRVIKVRLPVAASLAWLILIFFLPLVGAIAYLVLGEKRLGRQFMTRARARSALSKTWRGSPVRFFKIIHQKEEKRMSA